MKGENGEGRQIQKRSFREVVKGSTRDSLRALYGKHGSRVLWAQALGAAAVGLVAGHWVEVDAWFGASTETHRAVLTFVAATFVGCAAIIGAGFPFIIGGIQQRYDAARDRAISASLKQETAESTRFRMALLDAEYAIDLINHEARFEADEAELQVYWQACKRAARDDYVTRVVHRTLLKLTVSFVAISFAFLMIERAYNPLQLLIVGYFLLSESWFLSTVVTSNKIEDQEGILPPANV